MTGFIITIIIVLVVLTYIMFVFLKSIVNDISEDSKEYYLLKLQEYDELFKEREYKEIKPEEKKEEVKEGPKSTILCYDERSIDYQEGHILQKAKELDNQFEIDNVEVIKSFLLKCDIIEKTVYDDLTKLNDILNEKGLYNLVGTSKEDIKKLYDFADKETKSILNKYIDSEEYFNLPQFISCIKIEIKKNDPTIYIEVGDKNLNYDSLNSNIKTVYNKRIFKGIRIQYRNSLYDYSIE